MPIDINTLMTFDSSGFQYKDYPTFLQAVKELYQGIYGVDIYLEPDSQDGALVAAQAKAMYDVAAKVAVTIASFSPDNAQDSLLARLVKINGLRKRSATKSTVDLNIIGQSATNVTNGIAIDSLNQKWLLPSFTIPMGGAITVTATAEKYGAVTAEIGTINKIFTTTLGWQSVTNPALPIEGVAVESDAALRIRQAKSTAIPSLTVMEGIEGAVANVTGVSDVRGYQNLLKITDGNGLPPNSSAIVVVGGATSEIAQALQVKKTPGSTLFGSTTYNVYDSHGMPLTIRFIRATRATIGCRITLVAKNGWTTDFEPQIAAAVSLVINNFKIGKEILLTKLFSPAYLANSAAGQTYDISTIELRKNAGLYSQSSVMINFDEYGFSDPALDISFVVT